MYGCSKRSHRKEPRLCISSDWRPTWSAALSDRHEVSYQKNIRVCGAFFFFSRTALWNSIKIKKTKETCSRELIPCQALRRRSVCDPFGQVFCMQSSLSSASSMTGQIYLKERNVAGGEEEKEWEFAPESDNVVILVPYQVKIQSANRALATSVLSRAMNKCGELEPSLQSFSGRACGIRRLSRHHLLLVAVHV